MGLAILNTRSQIDKRIRLLVEGFINNVYSGKLFHCHTSNYGIELIHLADYHTEKESHFCEAYMNHPLVERTIKTSPPWTDGRRFKFPRVHLAANMTKNGDRVLPGLIYLTGSEWYSLGLPAEYDDIVEPMWRSFAEDKGVFTLPHPELLFAEKPDASGRTLYEHWKAYKDFLAGFDPASFKALKLIKQKSK